jgi:myo-inositol-1(or 4)-monophosphatase
VSGVEASLGAAELERALSVALAAAREAATLLREGFRADELTIEHKSAIDPVTEYDRRAEALLVGRLREAFPDHRLRGEEGGDQGADANDDERPIWYVDPLDGTVNFTHHIPWYAVSIGLEQGGQGQAALVLAVEQGWELTAIRGQGTRKDGKLARVSAAPRLVSSLLATGFPYRREIDDNVVRLSRALHRAQGIRRMGTASLDLAGVACGWLDGYWEPGLAPWDMSAGALLVQEAGGRVTAIDGGPFRAERASVLASNSLIHDDLLATLNASGTDEPEPGDGGRCPSRHE